MQTRRRVPLSGPDSSSPQMASSDDIERQRQPRHSATTASLQLQAGPTTRPHAVCLAHTPHGAHVLWAGGSCRAAASAMPPAPAHLSALPRMPPSPPPPSPHHPTPTCGTHGNVQQHRTACRRVRTLRAGARLNAWASSAVRAWPLRPASPIPAAAWQGGQRGTPPAVVHVPTARGASGGCLRASAALHQGQQSTPSCRCMCLPGRARARRGARAVRQVVAVHTSPPASYTAPA